MVPSISLIETLQPCAGNRTSAWNPAAKADAPIFWQRLRNSAGILAGISTGTRISDWGLFARTRVGAGHTVDRSDADANQKRRNSQRETPSVFDRGPFFDRGALNGIDSGQPVDASDAGCVAPSTQRTYPHSLPPSASAQIASSGDRRAFRVQTVRAGFSTGVSRRCLRAVSVHFSRGLMAALRRRSNICERRKSLRCRR